MASDNDGHIAAAWLPQWRFPFLTFYGPFHTPEPLCRKELISLRKCAANARLWESSPIHCPKAAGRIKGLLLSNCSQSSATADP